MILWQALQLGSSRVGLAKRADATGSSGRSPMARLSGAKNKANTTRARGRLRFGRGVVVEPAVLIVVANLGLAPLVLVRRVGEYGRIHVVHLGRERVHDRVRS